MKRRIKGGKALAHGALKLLEQEFQVAWAARDIERCLASLKKVVKLNPRSANAHLHLGRVYGLVYEYDLAGAHLEEAVRVSPKEQYAFALAEAGRVAKDFFDLTLASSFFDRAVKAAEAKVSPNSSYDDIVSKLLLAEHLIKLRNRDDALRIVEGVLERYPHDKEAMLLWCKLNEECPDNCLERLNDLVGSDHPDFRVRVLYQLGKTRDRCGDYRGAMDALVRAKSVMMSAREPVVLHRRRIREQFRELAEEFSNRCLVEWQRDGADWIEDASSLVLLGGHPRSGTTLLEQVIDAHPEIVSAEESENLALSFYCPLTQDIPRFSSILDALNDCSHQKLRVYRKEYLSLTEKCLGEGVGSRLIVDKNPSLTPLAPVLSRLFPDARMLIMLRDPRDIVLSCFMQAFVPPDVISGNFLTISDTAAEVCEFLLCWGELRESFGSQVREVRYEKLVDDFEDEVSGVLSFLGVGWDDSVRDYAMRAGSKVVRSPTAEAVAEKVHGRARGRWRAYEEFFGAALEELQPCLDVFGYD